MTIPDLTSSSKASFFSRWLKLSRGSLLLIVLSAAAAAVLQTDAVLIAAGILAILCAASLAVFYRYATYHIVSISLDKGIATIQAARFNARGRHIVPAHQVSASVVRVPLQIPALFRLTLEHGGQTIARQYSIEDWTEERLRKIAGVFEAARAAADA